MRQAEGAAFRKTTAAELLNVGRGKQSSSQYPAGERTRKKMKTGTRPTFLICLHVRTKDFRRISEQLCKRQQRWELGGRSCLNSFKSYSCFWGGEEEGEVATFATKF